MGDFWNVFHIGDLIIFINDNNTTGFKTQSFQEEAIVRPKGGITMVRKGNYILDPSSPAPTSLSKGQIHGNREDHDIGRKTSYVLIEPTGLGITDTRIKGRYNRNTLDFAFIVLLGLFSKAIIKQLEIRRLFSHFHFGTNKGYRASSKSNCTRTFFHNSFLLYHSKMDDPYDSFIRHVYYSTLIMISK